MTIEPTDAMARARASAVGVAFALAGSSMLAASLLFAQVVLRLRTAGGLPAASRPSAVTAMIVTTLMVLANLAFAATSPARRGAVPRGDVAWRRAPALVAVAFGMATAVVELYAGHVLFHAPARDVFGAIAASLFVWHALHMTAASIATVRVLRRDRAALAAPALLWNHAAFAWIGLAVALWVV